MLLKLKQTEKEKASKEEARRVWDGRKRASQYQPWGGAPSGGDSSELQAGWTSFVAQGWRGLERSLSNRQSC